MEGAEGQLLYCSTYHSFIIYCLARFPFSRSGIIFENAMKF